MDCTKRQPGCHGSCADYNEWAEKARRLNEAMQPSDAAAYLIERVLSQKKVRKR